MKQLINWDLIYQDHGNATYRCSVLGGWLINHLHHESVSLTFLPDPNHEWIPERRKFDVEPVPRFKEEKHMKELEFSARVYNSLICDSVKYVSDLIECSPSDLLKIPNFGRLSLVEVREVLHAHGLRLKNDYWVSEKSIDIPANFIHSNGDKELVMITGKDNKGNAWITWQRDGFKNMMPLNRLEIIGECRI